MEPITAPRPQPLRQYNFPHFRIPQALDTIGGLVRPRGIAPGAIAPDFELPTTSGGALRLSGLRGRPVLIRFGSGS